jgi:hypothetical protein
MMRPLQMHNSLSGRKSNVPSISEVPAATFIVAEASLYEAHSAFNSRIHVASVPRISFRKKPLMERWWAGEMDAAASGVARSATRATMQPSHRGQGDQ